jgi:hypothetical protein
MARKFAFVGSNFSSDWAEGGWNLEESIQLSKI